MNITGGTSDGVGGDPVALALANFSNGVRMALVDREVATRLAEAAETIVSGEPHSDNAKVETAVGIVKAMLSLG